MKVIYKSKAGTALVVSTNEYRIGTLETDDEGNEFLSGTIRYYSSIGSAVKSIARIAADEEAGSLGEWLDEFKSVIESAARWK